MPEHRVARCWECPITNASIEPIPVHRQLLGQPKDGPLPLELRLRPKLFCERDLPARAPHLPDERPGNPWTTRRTKPLCCEALGNLTVLVPGVPQRAHP